MLSFVIQPEGILIPSPFFCGFSDNLVNRSPGVVPFPVELYSEVRCHDNYICGMTLVEFFYRYNTDFIGVDLNLSLLTGTSRKLINYKLGKIAKQTVPQ